LVGSDQYIVEADVVRVPDPKPEQAVAVGLVRRLDGENAVGENPDRRAVDFDAERGRRLDKLRRAPGRIQGYEFAVVPPVER